MKAYKLRDATHWQTQQLVHRIASLVTGDHVRLIFDNHVEGTWEYMWVQVGRKSDGQWQGSLWNSPTCFKPSELTCGGIVAFRDKNIMEVASKAQGGQG